MDEPIDIGESLANSLISIKLVFILIGTLMLKIAYKFKVFLSRYVRVNIVG